MATTTNYGWDTPDDTDLVKDGAAAIRTLGSSVDTTTKNLNPQTTTGALAYRSATANVNTALPIGTAGQVLTVAAGVPSWATPSDQTPLTTKGDVFTFSTVDARLGVGANGTVLTADSAETTGLKWAAPAGGGKVLQVVNATHSTETTNTTSTYADTGLTATITPSSATSKILVLVHQTGLRKDGDTTLALRLVRTSTTIVQFETEAGQTTTSTRNNFGGSGTTYLDSPNTTSATTYKTTFATPSNTTGVKVQSGNSVSTITLLEIGA